MTKTITSVYEVRNKKENSSDALEARQTVINRPNEYKASDRKQRNNFISRGNSKEFV